MRRHVRDQKHDNSRYLQKNFRDDIPVSNVINVFNVFFHVCHDP